MKDFLKSELKTLKAKTGLNQYETFSAMPDAERQITILLDSMVLACNEFPYIPDMDKCQIIQKMIVQDQDFTALNSRSVWKWLNMHKEVYWGKIKHEAEKEIEHPPLTEEEKKELAEELERRKQSALGERMKFAGLNLTMEAIKEEDALRLTGEKVPQRGVQSGMTAYTVDVKNEAGELIMTVENVLAPNEDKAIILANEYALKQLK